MGFPESVDGSPCEILLRSRFFEKLKITATYIHIFLLWRISEHSRERFRSTHRFPSTDRCFCVRAHAPMCTRMYVAFSPLI